METAESNPRKVPTTLVRCDLPIVRVPRISTFYGIAVATYHAEHGAPNFRLVLRRRGAIAIATLEVLAGALPRLRSTRSSPGGRGAADPGDSGLPRPQCAGIRAAST